MIRLTHIRHDSITCHDSCNCDMPHLLVTYLVHIWLVLIHLWHDSLIYDMTHSRAMTHFSATCRTHLWRSSFIYDMTHSHMTWRTRRWSDSFMCVMESLLLARDKPVYVQWLIRSWHTWFICDMTHSFVTQLIYMWHDSFVRDTTGLCVTWLFRSWHNWFICDMTHWMLNLHPQCDSFTRARGMTRLNAPWLIHV